MNFENIKLAVQDARENAQREAKAGWSCVRSRGVSMCAYRGKEPLSEGSEHILTTKKSLTNFIERYEAMGADSVALFGGFDGADSVRDLNDYNYAALVTEWELVIYRDSQLLAEYK